MNSEKAGVVDEFQWCDAERLTRMVIFGTANMTHEDGKNVDSWAERERTSVDSILTSLALISCFRPVKLNDAPAHAYIINGQTVVDIIVVSGGVTHADNIEHALRVYQGRRERLYVIVSRDQRDNPLTDRDRLIYEVDPEIRRCGFHNLRSGLAASTSEEFRHIVKKCVGMHDEN